MVPPTALEPGPRITNCVAALELLEDFEHHNGVYNGSVWSLDGWFTMLTEPSSESEHLELNRQREVGMSRKRRPRVIQNCRDWRRLLHRIVR